MIVNIKNDTLGDAGSNPAPLILWRRRQEERQQTLTLSRVA